MAITFKSEEEYNSDRPQFSLLPEDQYLCEVLGGEDAPVVKSQPNIYNRTEEYPDGVPTPTLAVRMKAISFANGDALYDVDGEDVTREVKFFDWLDTTKKGLKPQPARFRKFIAAALGQRVEEPLSIESYDDLIGKRLVATIAHKKDRHKVKDYSLPRQRPARKAKAADETPDEAAVAKAKEVFGEDINF